MESRDRCPTCSPGVKAVKLGFTSHDGKTQIKALLWTPESVTTSPKGIIQITHGMEEHIGRYTEFANYLAQKGFVVCAQDMLGHGLSVTEADKLSCIPSDGGAGILIEDAHELYKMVASRYARQTPYFMFGHSMGSYIMRAYTTRYGEDLAGVVLSGAGQQSKFLSLLGNRFAGMLARSKGEDYRSPFLESMSMGAFTKGVKNPRTQYDWLCTDETVVDGFIADPLCGIPFSVGAYAALTEITGEVVSQSSAALVPKTLPILFVAGVLDPVGDQGAGVEKAADHLRSAGVERVEVKLYEGMRHEVINEPNKKEVYADILSWIEGVIIQRR